MDVFSSLSLAAVQQQAKRGKSVKNSNYTCNIKQALELQFPDLVSKSAYQSFNKSLLQSIKKVVEFLWPYNLEPCGIRPITEGRHIEQFSSCSDENFLTHSNESKVRSLKKLALDSRVLNISVHKNKYQMTNIEILMNSVSQHLSNTQNDQPACFQP